MSTRFAGLRRTAWTAAGQATWAAGQVVIPLMLSHQGQQRTVGVYSLGLGVFAILTLVLGFNLWLAIATDREHRIAAAPALALRLIACSLALPVAVAAMWRMAAGADELLLSSILVTQRVGDQLSEVVIGYYARDGRHNRIARSFFVRGAAAIAAAVGGWAVGAPLVTIALVMLAAVIAASMLADVVPLVRGDGRREKRTPAERLSMLGIIKLTGTISAYPALDSLHVNSFRFVLAIFVNPLLFGLIAIAQLIYVPFQLLASALAFTFIEEARRSHDAGSYAVLARQVRAALGNGALIGGCYVAVSLLMPDVGLRFLFANEAENARSALLVATIALALQPATGFLSQCVVTGFERRTYILAPIVGLAIVWGSAGLFWLMPAARRGGMRTAVMVGIVFAASFALRSLVSLAALRRIIGRLRRFEGAGAVE